MSDPGGSVRKIAAHLGLDPADETIAAVAGETSFARMRDKVEEIGSLDYGPNLIRHERTSYDPETLLHVDHIRNGESGYGATMLAPGQLRQIELLLEDKGGPR
jgi:hypothetical protein